MKEPQQRQTRFQSKAEQCGICYNAIEQQGYLDSCNHSFCLTCIKKWSNIENTCPLCKQKFKQIEQKWKRVFYQFNQVYYKSHKISKQKCKENKIFVKDKSQSQKEEQFNVLLELLIEFILADSIYNIYLLVND
ncbi:unnamed protein product [Paramecium pentaurelia]|uniref:RING-type domain-containing protein n=1 Tax=Paramecium pentaurelia TaxID=43138 RepID=A0A8S1XCB3_9CILI|nr:unnamed protein product [Paramecium pentaurelia]